MGHDISVWLTRIVSKWTVSKADGESHELDRETLEATRTAVKIAKDSKRVQTLGVGIAALGIVVAAVLAWQPWASHGLPRARVSIAPGEQSAVVLGAVGQLPPPPAYAPRSEGTPLWCVVERVAHATARS